MGGSCTLDIGIYALQFAQFVYKGLKPTDVTVTGHLNKHEVDDSVTAVLKYPNGKIAVCSLSCRAQFPNEAIIVGTKGTIRVRSYLPKFLPRLIEKIWFLGPIFLVPNDTNNSGKNLRLSVTRNKNGVYTHTQCWSSVRSRRFTTLHKK